MPATCMPSAWQKLFTSTLSIATGSRPSRDEHCAAATGAILRSVPSVRGGPHNHVWKSFLKCHSNGQVNFKAHDDLNAIEIDSEDDGQRPILSEMLAIP